MRVVCLQLYFTVTIIVRNKFMQLLPSSSPKLPFSSLDVKFAGATMEFLYMPDALVVTMVANLVSALFPFEAFVNVPLNRGVAEAHVPNTTTPNKLGAPIAVHVLCFELAAIRLLKHSQERVANSVVISRVGRNKFYLHDFSLAVAFVGVVENFSEVLSGRCEVD